MRRGQFVFSTSFVIALLLGVLAGVKATGASRQGAVDGRLNVLLITSEDNGPHLSCYGDKNIATPHLDKLAAEGVRFENAYVSFPSCSSSRSTIFTGLFPHQNGQIGLATHKFTMFQCWPTLLGILAANDYRTAVIGKIHVNPEEKAFKDLHRIDTGIHNNFRKRDVRAVAQRAGKFMSQSKKPFFLMINYPDAHWPFLRQQYHLPEKPLVGSDVAVLPSIGADSPRLRNEVANYYNCVKRLDTGIGLLLAALEQSGKADNTLVIFLGDHGAQFSRGKLTCYESGLRVPMIIRLPSRTTPGLVRHELMMTADVLPTILDATNLQTPENLPGRSLLPLLRAGEVPWRQYMYGEYNAATPATYFPQRAVRDSRFKLIVNLLHDRPNPVEHYYTYGFGRSRHYGTSQDEIDAAPPEVRRAYATWRDAPPVELYDLAEDPHEFNNLAGKPEYADIQRRLEKALRDWRYGTNDPLLDPIKLKRLTSEMDSFRDDSEYSYRKEPGFQWQYPVYLRPKENGQSTSVTGKVSTSDAPADSATETASHDETRSRHRLNVLFIAVDDLRPRLGCYGEPNVKSPNIDRLASEGLVLRNAFCQVASCNPSRCSLMTSRRPDTTTIVGNKRHFRSVLPDVVTLPQQFKRHGYHAQSLGKIFHGTFRSDKHQDPRSWSVPEWRPDSLLYASPKGIEVLKQRYPRVFKSSGRSPQKTMAQRRYKGLVWEAPDVADNVLSDGRLADKAIEVLRAVRDHPFFLGVGFVKPHVPYVAPKKYFDLYDLDDIELPENNQLPRGGVSLAHNDSAEVRGYAGVPKSGPIAEKTQREIALAYNACVSYVDAQIGRILDELDRLGLRERTVVVLWGDHGYHLGHNGLWGKNTNFDAAARVPLIVSVPGSHASGKTSDALVELVDLYPTLCKVCGVPLTEGLQGTSFAPLLENPGKPWKKAAFTQHPRPLYDRNAAMGHSMRTDRYRLTEWTGPRLAKPVYELYDYQKDPGETANLANRPEYQRIREELTDCLHAGWKAALPAIDQPKPRHAIR